jgi:hypothetical protein
MTIYRILCKSRLNNNPVIKPRKKRTNILFERKFPNELWQIDLKVIENEGKCLISIFAFSFIAMVKIISELKFRKILI